MPRAEKDIPVVLSLVILLACLGLGGWFVWSYFRSPADKVVAVIQMPEPATRPARQARPARPRATNQPRPFVEGIRRESRTRWLVRADNVLLCADVPAEGKPTLDYYMFNVLTEPQRDAATARDAIVNDPAVAAQLGLSADQVASLRKVSLTENVELSAGDLRVLGVTPDMVKVLQLATITSIVPLEPAEQETLAKGISEFIHASGREPRIAAERAVTAAVREVAAKHGPEIKKSQDARLAIMTDILTPQRTEQFKTLAPRHTPGATTVPSGQVTNPAPPSTTSPSPS